MRSTPFDKEIYGQGEDLTSAEKLGKDLAHLEGRRSSKKSSSKSPNHRSKSKSSATLDAKIAQVNHRNVVALDQYTSLNNSSQLSQQTRSEYLHGEAFNLYKALNAKSQQSKADLSKVRIRGKNILN